MFRKKKINASNNLKMGLHLRTKIINASNNYPLGCVLLDVTQSNLALLHCSKFGAVWQFVLRWLGFSTALPLGVVDHFNQFSLDGGNVKARGAILQVIWFATTWKIWKEINNMLFNGKHRSIPNVVEKIKSLAFMCPFSSLLLSCVVA